MKEKVVELIFVYGTLKRGYRLHEYLGQDAVYRGEGHIQGVLYDLGDFPGAKPGPGLIAGELYEVPEEALDQLDLIEGVKWGMFTREKATVMMGDVTLKAWTYYISEDGIGKFAPRMSLIKSGIWTKREERYV